MISADQKKKRLREGGVGPEIRSPALLVARIVRRSSFAVKARDTRRGVVRG